MRLKHYLGPDMFLTVLYVENWIFATQHLASQARVSYVFGPQSVLHRKRMANLTITHKFPGGLPVAV